MLGIDDNHRSGELAVFEETFEVALHPGHLATDGGAFLLVHLGEGTVLLHLQVGAVGLERLLNSREISERTTEPAVNSEGHTGRLSGSADDFLSLWLGRDEEHFLALGGDVFEVSSSGGEARVRLLEVDDRHAITVVENKRTGFRIPATGLVAEVHASVEEVFYGDVHGIFSSVSRFLPKERTLDQV